MGREEGMETGMSNRMCPMDGVTVERLVALLGTSAAGWWRAGRYPHGQGIERRVPKLASALAVLGAGSYIVPAALPALRCHPACPLGAQLRELRPILCTHVQSGYAPTYGVVCYALPSRAEVTAPHPALFIGPAVNTHTLTTHYCTHPRSGLLCAALPHRGILLSAP